MQSINFKPLYLLQRLIPILIILALAACASGGNNQGQGTGSRTVREGVIVFRNTTPFTVRLVRGSGRVDVGTIAPYASLTVTNTIGSALMFLYPMIGRFSVFVRAILTFLSGLIIL